jgi:deazaflavin-dependent oxidoreductase (nitroreductase family)
MPDAHQFLYLTTRGRATGLPREIEIWFTELDGHFYVIAEFATSQWVQNLRVHPQAQVRVGEKTFAARARLLALKAHPQLHTAVQELSRKKYGWGDGLIVELTPENS